jgi:hypothetical protein
MAAEADFYFLPATEPIRGFERLIAMPTRSLESLKFPAFCFVGRFEAKQFCRR